jgi:hypothetical protein
VIDFRYHLVSLISVFLALAVGIVLGAGPLKEAIGDTLTGEVEDLRTASADLRTELAEAESDVKAGEEAFSAAAPYLLAETLDGRRVAVIEIGGTDGPVLQGVTERIAEAGATVSATVHVTTEWTVESRLSYRRALSESLLEYLDPVPSADAGTGTELSEALVQALTNASADDPDTVSESAGVILELLAEGGLIQIDGEISGPAEAVVLVVGPDADVAEPSVTGAEVVEPGPAEVAELEASEDAVVELAVVAQRRSGGAVVATHALADGGVLRRLHEDARAAESISTVAYAQTVVGQVSVPLALSERIGGAVGHYGPYAEATAPVPPRVVLPPPGLPSGVVEGNATGGAAGSRR